MTKQGFVADEQLAVITRRVHELMKRVLAGVLDPARVAAGLQQIIEGNMPAEGDSEAVSRPKYWVSIRDARRFGESNGYSRAAVGQMYGLLVRGVSGRRAYGVPPAIAGWPVEHRGDREFGQPTSMEFECASLLRFVESGTFTSLGMGAGEITNRLFIAWIDYLSNEERSDRA
jgi:hypothetical protein